MIAGLFEMAPPTLPAAAHLAQVVLAGTVAVHLGVLRPASARADLLLEAEMVHSDLTAYIGRGQLPGDDPQVQNLERTLAALGRLPRRSAARALVRGGLGAAARGAGSAAVRAGDPAHWWTGDDADSRVDGSELLPQPRARFRSCLHRLDDAAARYLQVTRPWRLLRRAQAPRHATNPSSPAPGPAPDHCVHSDHVGPAAAGQAAARPAATSTANSTSTGTLTGTSTGRAGTPQRHVRQTRALVRAALRPDQTPSVPISAGDIATAISRSQGRPGTEPVAPAVVAGPGPDHGSAAGAAGAAGPNPRSAAGAADHSVELATTGLDDLLPHH